MNQKSWRERELVSFILSCLHNRDRRPPDRQWEPAAVRGGALREIDSTRRVKLLKNTHTERERERDWDRRLVINEIHWYG